MKTLTIFTPAYNRKHTIGRTYQSLLRQTCKDVEWLIIDDGSTDGTKDWVQSLGSGEWVEGCAYDWMGRRTKEKDLHYVVDVPFADGEDLLHITYIYKPNGGLYTGYNVAYDFVQTELCVCIDSDDFAPDDMVDKVVTLWKKHYPEGSINHKLSIINHKEYCGIVGLDFNVVDKLPIGGFFADGITEGFYADVKRGGDTKEVMRTDLMKTVSPQIGFEGEKDFNPFYMLSQVVDKYPILVENSNLCWVEYQLGADSMSQAIYKQFMRSPRSYAKYRINQMKLTHNNGIVNRFKLAIHYVSSCMFAKDNNWQKNVPYKFITICAVPFGVVLYYYIRYKANQK